MREGFRTLTETAHDPAASSSSSTAESSTAGSLRLRGQHEVRDRSVIWAEGTVDNEFLGRKKSKSSSPCPAPLFNQVDGLTSLLGVGSLLHLPQAAAVRRVVVGGRW